MKAKKSKESTSRRPIRWRPLSDFAVRNRGSVDPKKFLNEEFELFSIPAYDTGCPEELKGSEIGSSKISVEPGDVLISKIIPHIQRVWIVPKKNGKRQIASGEWLVFRGEEIAPEFLRHMLFTKPFHDQFMQTVAGMGGSLLRARPSEVARIEIPVSNSIDEQRGVAEILNRAENIRRKRGQALHLANGLLKSVFLEMFGDPVVNPRGLRQKPLDKCARFISGATPSKSNPVFWEGEFPWVSPKDMKVDTIYDAQDHISEFVFERTNLKRIQPGTPLIVVRGMILDHTVPMAIAGSELAINQDMKAIEFEDGIDPLFGYWCLKVQHSEILGRVSTAAHGTKRLDTENLGAVPVSIPTDEQQRLFVSTVKKFNGARSGMEKAASEAKNMFDALSQCAFRGEL
jgi:type I restriction enzyme, S subunit